MANEDAPSESPKAVRRTTLDVDHLRTVNAALQAKRASGQPAPSAPPPASESTSHPPPPKQAPKK